MDYATILTAVGASIATGLVSTLSTVAALRVHIMYLREKSGQHQRRQDVFEKRLFRSERDVAHLQTKTKEL